MLFGVLALITLAIAFLVVRRRGVVVAGSDSTHAAFNAVATRKSMATGIAIVLLANAPVAFIAMPFFGLRALGPGDLRTHAMVAKSIAEHGLPHGWTDAYQSGFAVGPHYPSIGWLLSAFLIKLGVHPQSAVDVIGLTALLLAPVLVFCLAHAWLGARLSSAAFVAIFVSWISPVNPVVGGWDALYSFGLLSQVVALPSVLLLVAGIFDRRKNAGPWTATIPAALAMASHPQITTACIGAMLVPLLASSSFSSAEGRALLLRYVRAAVTAIAMGAAIYAPGVATLKVPFGWPPMPVWRTVGFGPDSLFGWLIDGELLDTDRTGAAILTSVWGIALLVALLRARASRAARGVAIASVLTVVLSVSGDHLGAFVLSFFQPLRMMTVIPIAAAATLLVAIEEGVPLVRTLLLSLSLSRFRNANAALGSLAVIAFIALALPARVTWAREGRARFLAYSLPDAPCGATHGKPRGFETNELTAWLGSLSPDGRLWYEQQSKSTERRPTATAAQACDYGTGFDLASSAPVAVTIGMGVQVGVHMVAFHELHPTREGSASRAEALGIRHMLLIEHSDPPAFDFDGWDVVHHHGDVLLLKRHGGTDFVGAGCIDKEWRGSDSALRNKLITDVKTDAGASRLLNPHSLIAVTRVTNNNNDGGDVVESDVATNECDASDARILERRREPGAYEAEVESTHPFDVVIRAAAFPTWRVSIDGVATETKMVAPGFVSARVGAGKHHVEAVVSTLPWYIPGIALAIAITALLSLRRLPRLRRS